MFSDGKVKCLFPLAGDIEEHGECRMNQTRVQSFVGVLRHHYNLGHHLIVSWEGLSLLPEERLDLLGNVFRAAGYEPRIVVTSRYYHEWVPSWIQQHFRPAGYNPQLNKFEDAGATIPTIQQFLEDPLPYHTHCYFGLADCHYGWLANEDAPAANLRDRFQRFFNNVQIFQFNQEGDLVTNFVCQTLRYAKKTCRGLQDGTLLVPEHLQESIARSIMDYEYLAQAAYDKYYLLQYSEKRRAFVGMIQKHHQRKISSCKFSCSHAALRPFVLQCPTENEKRIFTNRSIAYERELFPDDFVLNDAGEDYESMLRNEAMYKMKGDKYCLINVHKTLEEPQWDVFFRYLEEGKDPYAEKRQPWSKVGFSDRHASPHSILKRSQH